MFKSHYVVWKLFFKLINNPQNEEFKSHYVVWKRFENLFTFFLGGGLNRTM